MKNPFKLPEDLIKAGDAIGWELFFVNQHNDLDFQRIIVNVLLRQPISEPDAYRLMHCFSSDKSLDTLEIQAITDWIKDISGYDVSDYRRVA